MNGEGVSIFGGALDSWYLSVVVIFSLFFIFSVVVFIKDFLSRYF